MAYSVWANHLLNHYRDYLNSNNQRWVFQKRGNFYQVKLILLHQKASYCSSNHLQTVKVKSLTQNLLLQTQTTTYNPAGLKEVKNNQKLETRLRLQSSLAIMLTQIKRLKKYLMSPQFPAEKSVDAPLSQTTVKAIRMKGTLQTARKTD